MSQKSNKIGGDFEKRLNVVFKQYREDKKAYIIKVPTEFTIIRNKGKIVNAISKKKSDCLDYIGFLPNGKCFVFEAKTHNNKTSFPLSNIKDYQYDLVNELYLYIQDVFFIIEWRFYNEVYLVPANKVVEFKNSHTRKSIPYGNMKEMGILLDNDLNILKILQKIS